MAATTTFTSPTTMHTKSRSGPARLWKTGLSAGIAASVATSATAGLASAAGVPRTVAGASIPLVGFAELTFVASMIGTVLAVVLRRRSGRPRHAFVVTTALLTVASIVPDVLADAHTATRLTLALTHLVAAAIVIPALASRLTD